MRTALHVTALSLVLWLSGCGSDDKSQAFSTKVLTNIDINNSHYYISGNFGASGPYRQIDMNGSFSPEAGFFYNGEWGHNSWSTIDFNKSDVALFTMHGRGGDDFRYYVTRVTEYASYIVLSGEFWQYNGGGEISVAKPSAWIELSKYDKPILYDERLYYTLYESEVHMYPDISPKVEAQPKTERVSFEVLAQGYVKTAERVGKHYEKVVSRERLAVLYATAGLDPKIADTVDFTAHNVLALFMGSTDTPNSSIKLQKIVGTQATESHTAYDAYYYLVHISNALATTTCNSEERYLPYQFIAVPATVGELVFVDSANPVACK